MALRVWLPLNKGNIINQGLSSATITGTPSYTSNGKIGAYALNGGTIQIKVPEIEDTKICTFSFWAYITSSLITSNWTRVARFNDKGTNAGSNMRFEVCPSSYSNGIYCFSNHNNASYGLTTGCITSPTGGYYDQWVHFCFTSDGTVFTRYMNGVKIGTCNYTGEAVLSGDFFLENNDKCFKQDVRVYDHCLSPKEVKEISKGLVAHYKLEGTGANPNLLENTKTFEGWTVGSGWIKTIESDGTAMYSFSRTGATANTWVRLIPAYHIVPSNFPNGVAVSFDFMVDDLDALNKQIICALQNYNDSGTRTSWVETNGLQYYINGDKVVSGQWIRLTKLWTQAELSQGTGTTYSTLSFQLVQNGSIHIKNIKCENGNAPTNYIPNMADAAYTALGYDNMIARDVSGNGYNGAVSGTLSYNIDSPRYSGSTLFNGSSYITSTSGSMAWYNFDNLTISAWLNPTVTPSSWTGSIGIQLDGSYTSGRIFSISNYAGKFSVHTDTNSGWVTTQSETLPLNTWSHCVATLENGTDLKMYLNGQLVKTVTLNWGTNSTLTASNSRISIGVDLPGDDEKYTGSYSDIRIYATALTADDILTLYKTSGIIDNKGNVYAYEFKEE